MHKVPLEAIKQSWRHQEISFQTVGASEEEAKVEATKME